ncbi:MAG: amidase [Deltaproteobacteria bacterium]|nr:amidase [Deltaproteobacteria bacterium]
MTYDLKVQRTPRLVGRGLRIAMEALERERIGAVLQRGILLGAGLEPLRERPTKGLVTPLWMAPDERALLPQRPLDLGRVAASGEATSGVGSYARAYGEGRTTPTAVAERFLATAADLDRRTPALRWFVSLDADDVRAQARESTLRWAAGRPLSVLDGVPVPVKDEVDQRGHRTTAGTRALATTPAAADSAPVARLRALGALLVGKTNMHELGAGATGLNIPWGTARNPWDVRYHTGGSSSGSGGAAASGLAPFALGCDGGGSIRIPASFCGVVGLKPTYGRVPKVGAVPLAPSLQHVGPLARTVRDTAIGYVAMAGRDARELHTLAQPPLDDEELAAQLSRTRLDGVTLGIYPAWFEDADAAVVARCREALLACERRGAKLRDVEVPDLELARVAHIVLIAAESRAFVDTLGDRCAQLGFDVRLGLAVGKAIPPEDVLAAHRHRVRLGESWLRAMDGVDAIVTPTMPQTAPLVRDDSLECGEVDAEGVSRMLRFTVLANLLGTPAVSVPVGFVGGLPVGLQLQGRPWDEARLFGIAAVLEDACREPTSAWKPAVGVDLLAD